MKNFLRSTTALLLLLLVLAAASCTGPGRSFGTRATAPVKIDEHESHTTFYGNKFDLNAILQKAYDPARFQFLFVNLQNGEEFPLVVDGDTQFTSDRFDVKDASGTKIGEATLSYEVDKWKQSATSLSCRLNVQFTFYHPVLGTKKHTLYDRQKFSGPLPSRTSREHEKSGQFFSPMTLPRP